MPKACALNCCAILDFAFPAIERLSRWQQDACDVLQNMIRSDGMKAEGSLGYLVTDSEYINRRSAEAVLLLDRANR